MNRLPGLHVLITHSDGYKVCYTVNEMIDALVIDRVHFPNETNRTIIIRPHDEYLKNYGYGPDKPYHDLRETCYHFCDTSATPYKILGTNYTNGDAKGR